MGLQYDENIYLTNHKMLWLVKSNGFTVTETYFQITNWSYIIYMEINQHQKKTIMKYLFKHSTKYC